MFYTNEKTGFWVVWSPRGGQPRVRHEKQHEADAEAERLSLRFPGRHFYVLECVGAHREGPETLTARQQVRRQLRSQSHAEQVEQTT